nr:hypothetical protein BCU39_21885 [Vibrio cyclitrophicus]
MDLSDGDIFIFHTTPPVASLIMNEKKVNLLEDGFLNYGFARFSKFHNFVRFIFGYSRHYRLGCEENVDTIYLKYPTSDKLTVEQRNKAKKLVIDYYSINVGDISSMFYCYSDSVIILTQPLNEKEYCSFTEKIYLYQLLSDFLSEKHPGKSKYIKLHPLEDDEKNHNAYASIVGIDGIVENDFPSEILGNLLKDVCFYSFFSSSGVDNNFTVLKSDYYQGIRDIIVSGRLHGLV